MGVPVVRILGLGVPLCVDGAGGSGFRKGTAHSVFARMVHAPERRDTRLRMEFFGCESARACLGGLARLQDRGARQRESGSSISRACVSQAAAEFHLVGESQGPAGKERVRGRISGARQYRSVRSFQAARPWNVHRTVDGTSWMAMFCLDMLSMSIELAQEDPAYEDVASKFFEHFVFIAQAMNDMGGQGIGLWDEGDGFYYDALHLGKSSAVSMKVRSMVGLIPLFASETFEPEVLERLPSFRKRMQWFLDHNPEVSKHVDMSQKSDKGTRLLLTIANREKLERIYRYVFDENEFLSPHGIRALSKFHLQHPFVLNVDGHSNSVDYEPAESTSDLFGGNSNWRGPVWFPLNFLLIEALQRVHYYYGEDFKVEFPTNSGRQMTLWDSASEISRRLSHIFLRRDGRRAVFGDSPLFQQDPNWRDFILFYEYFHGDTGAGLGASHQTGWTALVAKLLQQSGEEVPRFF